MPLVISLKRIQTLLLTQNNNTHVVIYSLRLCRTYSSEMHEEPLNFKYSDI